MPNTAKTYPFKIYRKNTDHERLSEETTRAFAFRTKQPETITFLPQMAFSEREVDIVSFMAMGLTAQEIAQELYLSPHTIKTHQKNILKKTGCRNSSHLIASCLRSNVIE